MEAKIEKRVSTYEVEYEIKGEIKGQDAIVRFVDGEFGGCRFRTENMASHTLRDWDWLVALGILIRNLVATEKNRFETGDL